VEPTTVKRPKVSVSLEHQSEDDLETKDTRERSPSPPKNDLSVYLHIKNLVRPFTNNQLKGLIEKTGKISPENGFWINSIKSFCYVKVNVLRLFFCILLLLSFVCDG